MKSVLGSVCHLRNISVLALVTLSFVPSWETPWRQDGISLEVLLYCRISAACKETRLHVKHHLISSSDGPLKRTNNVEWLSTDADLLSIIQCGPAVSPLCLVRRLAVKYFGHILNHFNNKCFIIWSKCIDLFHTKGCMSSFTFHPPLRDAWLQQWDLAGFYY